ncbi:MAG: hypothetical protein MJ210_02060 [Alphaproteobacteria bacterium]|nr:hypothetical protein [Alphaproteobacteria bacterium]
MKKQAAAILAVFMLGACSGTEGWFHSGDDEIEYKEVVVDRYSLAKRGDRYDAAGYTIAPEVYEIVATRATNKILSDAPGIWAEDKNAPLYITETVKRGRFMPDDPDIAGQASKTIITGSKMFNLADNEKEAKYILRGTLNNVNTPEIPVIVYELTLYDAEGNVIDSWDASIRQIQNDDGSWW